MERWKQFCFGMLGLSTQVPAVWSYISNGPYRSRGEKKAVRCADGGKQGAFAEGDTARLAFKAIPLFSEPGTAAGL